MLFDCAIFLGGELGLMKADGNKTSVEIRQDCKHCGVLEEELARCRNDYLCT